MIWNTAFASIGFLVKKMYLGSTFLLRNHDRSYVLGERDDRSYVLGEHDKKFRDYFEVVWYNKQVQNRNEVFYGKV